MPITTDLMDSTADWLYLLPGYLYRLSTYI